MLLAQSQLYNGYPADAMRTALRLRAYEKVLPPDQIYAIIALSAFYAKFYGQCSKVSAVRRGRLLGCAWVGRSAGREVHPGGREGSE